MPTQRQGWKLGLVWLALGLLELCGCGRSPAPTTTSGGVGVVDLDAVAKALGRDTQMQQSAGRKVAELTREITDLQAAMNRRLVQENEQLEEETGGGKPAANAQKELLQTRAKMVQKLREKKAEADRLLAQHRASLIAEFREETRPVLRESADQRGLSIVIPKNEVLLLTVNPAVDLTDAVVARLKSTGGSAPSPRSDGPTVPPVEESESGNASEAAAN
ncbi:MAG: OmpH family outer membrane protein [Planctomycetaceae bacterium]